jgi:hypothetical protein
MLPAQVRHRRAGLRLLQHRPDLAVAELGSLHAELPPGEKILLLRPPVGWGDYHHQARARMARFLPPSAADSLTGEMSREA